MDIKNRFRVLKTVLIASTLALVGASLVVAPAAQAAGGMVSVTFDDGWTSQYNNALPVLNKYGVPATMYIISGSVNDVPDYMTQAQIQAFANRGDEIASHTVTHSDLTTLGSTQLNNELAQSQTTLRQMFGPSAAVDFASPYGAYNATTTAAVQKYYATQRNTDEGFNPQTGFNPYNMLVQNVVSTTSAATVQGWINSAKANNTWLVLVYHEVGASIGGDIYHTDTAALDSHMAAVKNSGLPMVTVRQGVQALTSPTTTAPAAPTQVTATAGNASATVSWTAPNNGGSPITSYTVTPRTGTTNLTPVTITGNPPATSTTVSGLTNGTAYTFTVTATNAVGTSPASAASNSVTPAAATTAPAAPTGVTATAGNASATVSWTAPSNGGSAITSYTVTPRTGTTNLNPVTVTGNPPATSTTISGLTNGAAYTFTVTATNATGTSPASAASNSVTPAAATTAPAAPTGVTATAGNASATVSWSAPNNGGSPITSYTVTPRTGTTNLTTVTVTGNPPATSTTISGLTNGTAYTFTVTATNATGTSPASAASNSVTPAAATTDGTITNGGFESGLTGWTTSGVRAPVASTTARTGTGSALLGVSSGSEPLGNSVLSQTITVPATGTPTLSFWYKPHTTDEPCTGTACRYDWMEAQLRSTTGTVLQSLFKRASNSATWTRITADLSAYKGQNISLWFNVHLDGAVPADNTWMYLDDVTLTNTQTTTTAPAAPTGVTAAAGNASATVSWTAPSNGGSAITSYTVTPRTGTTNLTPVTVSGNPPATSTTITGLTNGTAYTFTVTATNAVGTSPASAASNSVTPAAATTDGTITNGGFESGLTGWTTSGVRAPVASTTARTGTGSALLGVPSGPEPLGESSLSQTITVPATGTSTLSFWYQPHTVDEICNGTACRYDWMEAQLRSTTGTVLRSLFKLANNSGTWTRITADLSAYRGQNITLWFNVHSEGAVPADDTWMFLDDVTLTNTQTTTTAPAAPTGLSAPAGNSTGSLQALSRRELAPGILRN